MTPTKKRTTLKISDIPVTRDDLLPNDMMPEEARECVDKIKNGMDSVRTLLFELRDRRGWVALGYRSLRDCVLSEFGYESQKMYLELQAAEVELDVDPNRQHGFLAQQHAKELKKLPKELRKEVYEITIQKTDGNITTEALKETVDELQKRDGEMTASIFRRLTPEQQKAFAKAQNEKYKRSNKVLDELEEDERSIREESKVKRTQAENIRAAKAYFRKMIPELIKKTYFFPQRGDQLRDMLTLFLESAEFEMESLT